MNITSPPKRVAPWARALGRGTALLLLVYLLLLTALPSLAKSGGSSGEGTVFAVNTDGTGFTTLHSFTSEVRMPDTGIGTNSDGAYPVGGLTLCGNTMYGTAVFGGSSGSGTIFSILLAALSPPQLSISPAGTNVLLTWPTNLTGFNLQFTTNLGSSAIWTNNGAAPVVLNGQNTVTNPILGTQQFFRLSQ